MKRLLGIAFGLIFLATGCSKVDGESTNDAAGVVMQQKTWRMTGYYDDGVDRLANFTGYAFTFRENGEVLAYRDGREFKGIWATTTTRSFADSSEVEGLTFQFDNERPFNSLNKTWEVMKKTTKTVHLRYQDLPKEPVYDDIFLRINY